MPKKGRIFISYRREDASGDARSIFQRLERVLGKLIAIALSIALLSAPAGVGAGNTRDFVGAETDRLVSEQDLPERAQGSRVYVSLLSFVDAGTLFGAGSETAFVTAGIGHHISQTVEEYLEFHSASFDLQYVINDPQHQLPNTVGNARRLSSIYWDPNLAKSDKIDKIISELLEPNKVDALVWGQFQQAKDGTISVRPFIIFRQTKIMATESRRFDATDFYCTDPTHPERKVICSKAAEEIRDLVMRLLKQL